MGEIAQVDLGRLRVVVERISTAASEIADMHWPELDPDDLRGSAVSASAAAGPAVDRIRGVAETLRDWAAAAAMAADEFERADAANGERFAPR